MIKLDAYRTLTEWADVFRTSEQSDEYAQKNPFLLAIRNDEHVTVRGCCTSGNIEALVRAVVAAYAKSMKEDGVSAEKFACRMAMHCAKATSEAYGNVELDEERIEQADKEIKKEEMMEGLSSILDGLFSKMYEETEEE